MKNKQALNQHEWLLLSAYLDGQLSKREKRQVDELLQTNPASRKALESLRRTRQVLKFAPVVKVPRNFTLSAEMVRKPLLPSFSRVLSFSSAMAAILLAVVFSLDVFSGMGMQMASEIPADVSSEMVALESDKAIVEATEELFYSAVPQEEEAGTASSGGAEQAYGMGGGGGDQGAVEEAERLPVEPMPSTTTEEETLSEEAPSEAAAAEEASQAAPEEMPQELRQEGAPAAAELEVEAPDRVENDLLLGARPAESTGAAPQISLRWVEIGLALAAILTGLAARLLKRRK